MVEADQEVSLDSEAPAESENVESQEAESQGAETESQEQKVRFDEAQQAKVEEIKGEQAGRFIQRERKLKKELEETQRLAAELQAKIPEPVVSEIPPMPDPDSYYDDPTDYNQKIAERERLIEQRAEQRIASRLAESQQQAEAQRQAELKQQENAKAAESYLGNATKYGIPKDRAFSDAEAFNEANISENVQNLILKDELGPLMANDLAGKTLELDNISRMDDISAGIYIATVVKPRLAGAKKSTTAPKPVDVTDGASVSADHPLTKGAIFR